METLLIQAGPVTYELKRKGPHSRAWDCIAAHTHARGNAEQFVGITFFQGDPPGYWSKGAGPTIQGRLNRA